MNLDSKKSCLWGTIIMFAMAAFYWGAILMDRRHFSPETFDDASHVGIMILAGTIGMAIRTIFWNPIDQWKQRMRKKLGGSILGFDLAKWWRDKSNKQQ